MVKQGMTMPLLESLSIRDINVMNHMDQVYRDTPGAESDIMIDPDALVTEIRASTRVQASNG